MNVSQSQFIQAIFDSTLPVPEGIVSQSSSSTKRFSVYRNNVIVSLIESLEATYPIICKLVGDEFFKAMAGNYVRNFPPKSPLMLLYGIEFPEFLKDFEPVRNLPYLSDVGRIERALRESYHSKDSRPISQDVVDRFSQENLPTASISLAPSLIILHSQYPVFSIWYSNMKGEIRNPPPEAQNVAIIRKQYDPIPRLLVKGEFEMLDSLQKGHSIGNALEAALAVEPEFDLGSTLTWLLNSNSITALDIKS